MVATHSVLLSLRALLALSLLVVASLAGCSDPPNTQVLPIGERCGGDGDCGTAPYGCKLAGYPGGYCQRSCSTDGDCPMDSVCVSASVCRRYCPDPTECRQTEGYACLPAGTNGATKAYCDLPAAGP